MKSDSKTNVSNALVGPVQHSTCGIEASRGQALVWRLLKRLLEHPQKMIGRQAGNVGEVVQRERLVVERKYVVSGPVQAAI